MEGNIRTLTARDIRLSIKHGMPVDSICEKYGCDYEAFCSRMKILFKHDWKSTIKEINQSATKTHGRSKGTKKALIKGEEILVQMEAAKEMSEDPSKEAKTQTSKLDSLKQTECDLRQEVIGLENQCKNLRNSIEENKDRCRKIIKLVQELKQKFQESVADFRAITHSVDEAMQDLEKTARELRAKKAELKQVRAEIKILETVTLCIYSNGIIEPVDASIEVILDDTGFAALADKLYKEEVCENLKIKDIKVLAKTICIVNNAKQDFDLMFDNPELETAYNYFFQNNLSEGRAI